MILAAADILEAFYAKGAETYDSDEFKTFKATLTPVFDALAAVNELTTHFSVNFSDNFLGDLPSSIFVDSCALKRPKCITNIVFRNCGLSSALPDSFGESLAKLPLLRKLDVSCNPLGPALKTLLLHLQRSTSISTLNISDTEANDDICSDIKLLVEKNDVVCHLELSENFIADEVLFDPIFPSSPSFLLFNY